MDIGKENKARELYTRAMKYIYGDGVEENNLLAVRFLEESHRLGLPEATYNLGICYHYGYGVSPDPEIAFSLYLESAEAGFGKGMELVGRFYNQGKYVIYSRPLAELWLQRAMGSSDPEAIGEAKLEWNRRPSVLEIACVWEHNGNDTLLYAANLPGAYTRGLSLEEAMTKMAQESRAYLMWSGSPCPDVVRPVLVQDAACDLEIRDADSDVLFHREQQHLSIEEYQTLKGLVLKSAEDFHNLYLGIPLKDVPGGPVRKTFYGKVPGTVTEMYNHTKSVNAYYFGEIGVDVDNEGTILDCRLKGFSRLEQQRDFLQNLVVTGSYGEQWNLRKVLRRFLWHDRIHARAMYRLGVRLCGIQTVPDLFFFG